MADSYWLSIGRFHFKRKRIPYLLDKQESIRVYLATTNIMGNCGLGLFQVYFRTCLQMGLMSKLPVDFEVILWPICAHSWEGYLWNCGFHLWRHGVDWDCDVICDVDKWLWWEQYTNWQWNLLTECPPRFTSHFVILLIIWQFMP